MAERRPDPVGDPRSLARAISLVEDEAPSAADLIRTLYPRTGRAYQVGVTGPPGAGKSTLVDRLITEIRRATLTVGVIAVDPTSPFTGGAVLGDRVRMGGHASDPGVFIRSMATRGQLGGMARATGDVAILLDAAGFDVVIIETVGVGQAETEVARTADVTVVTLVPGAGDDVQALKAGVMEIADIFVVNKADQEGADRLVQSVQALLSLQTFAPGSWRPPVLKTIATEGTGVPEVWASICAFRDRAPGDRAARERQRHERRLRDALGAAFEQRLSRQISPAEWNQAVDALVARTEDPYSAASGLMQRL